MKKLLLFTCAILLSTVNLIAQEHTIYYENFDANDGGWTSSTASGKNGSWVYDTGATLYSEDAFWRINSFNYYGPDYLTYLTNPSPISTLGFTNVKIYIDVRHDTSNDWSDDGMQIQYTTDPTGTIGWSRLGNNLSPGKLNWYNNNDVDAIANNEHGWVNLNAENSKSNSKFIEASVPFIPLDNQPSLRFRFVFGSDSSSNDVGVAIDNVIIKGDYIIAPSDPINGPGSINSNLKLWLKADTGTNTTTNNTAITTWYDQAFDNDAESYGTVTPLFKNNATDNINFNPVIDFNRSANNVMKGKGGYWTQDYWVVVQTHNTFDKTTSNTQVPISGKFEDKGFSQDGTGLGLGRISSRFNSDNLVAHIISTYNSSTSGTAAPGVDSYGRSYAPSSISSLGTDVMIFNVKSDTSVSPNVSEIYYNGKRVDNHTGTTGTSGTGNDLIFAELNNLRYILGTGQFTANQHALSSYLDGKISEVASYSSPKSALDQQKIQSYLGIKYGVTLKASGSTSEAFDRIGDVDYIDSSGNVIWDVATNSGYNYDIAGIGRDDSSTLNQKQSKSVNETSDGTGLLSGILTMGLTDIYDVNSTNIASNPTNLGDQEFLVWGNNGADITLAPFTVNVDMSAGISGLTTPVTFDGMQRIWKVVEIGGDIPSVKVSIPKNAVRNISPPGSYLMFISDTNIFDPTADYRVMTEDGFGNLRADYDFDGVKYITFGYAPQVIVERSVYFDGANDYIDVGDYKDLNSSFTVSAWIKRTSGANDVSIFSKRDASFTEGYDFLIESGDRVEMVWNGGSDNIRGNTSIPENEWHHVAVIYSGGTANLFIDGVLDETKTGLSNPTPTTQSFIIAAAGKTSTTSFFEGNIDEVRIWDVPLSQDELHYVMNQEIEENATFVDGMELPTSITKNEINSIDWSDLIGYYPMSIYTYTNTNDHSVNQNQGALRNLDTVDWQTAPLPYESQTDGPWTTDATWLNNAVQTLPNDLSIVDGTTPVDWNIVVTNHDITIDTNAGLGRERSVLGLIVNSNELTINGDTSTATGNGLTVTHYLELNGSIDLEGESQLIQSANSVLEVGTNGTLEQDQQGTADTYTYNYWSSPVGSVNITANNATYKSRFTLPDVLNDGTTPTSPVGINFLSSGYNGTNTNPIGIADYWIWKFADLEDGNYSLWQHMRSTGNILPGEGFTMKGPGTGTISTPQNYVFNGKPNNGDISFSIAADNDYLVGNPYPSAINAHTFLNDNTHTNGTLYFWEHYGGGSHNLGSYQGGYALLNFSGATPTPSYATPDEDVSQTGSGTKLPGQYIPVGQGFFVYSGSGGTMRFENDQRVFQKEGATSTFMRMNSESASQPVDYNEDGRMKLRIGFDSFNGIHRQLLLTVDQNASENVDWGYDGKLNGNQIDDMYWMIDNDKYVIQGVNIINPDTEIPLGIHVDDNGLNNITIDHLENVPDDLEIYVHDNVLDIYHDLRQIDYEVNLTAGNNLDRFAIVFSNPNATALSNDEFETNSAFEAFYSGEEENFIIRNPNLINIESMELFNILGQSIYFSNEIETQNNTKIKVSNLSVGTYIINLNTESGKISKKVLVE